MSPHIPTHTSVTLKKCHYPGRRRQANKWQAADNACQKLGPVSREQSTQMDTAQLKDEGALVGGQHQANPAADYDHPRTLYRRTLSFRQQVPRTKNAVSSFAAAVQCQYAIL